MLRSFIPAAKPQSCRKSENELSVLILTFPVVRFFKYLKGYKTKSGQRCNGEHHVTFQSRLKWPLADYGQKHFVKIIVAIVKEGH